MSDFLKALQQPEYVHVLINHLPLTGLLAAVIALAAAIAARSRAAIFIGLGLVVVFALSVWPVYLYGERGYDRTLAMADDDGAAYLTRHRELAERWVFLYYVTAAVAVIAGVIGMRWPRYFSAAAAVAGLLAVGSLAAGAVIAECGGKIRHREFRFGPPPAQQQTSGRDSSRARVAQLCDAAPALRKAGRAVRSAT